MAFDNQHDVNQWWKYGNNTLAGEWMLVKSEDTRFNCGRGSRWQLRLNFESVAIFLEVYQQDIHQNLFHNILARGWIMEKTVEGGADRSGLILDRSQFLLLSKPTTSLLSRSSSAQVKRHTDSVVGFNWKAVPGKIEPVIFVCIHWALLANWKWISFLPAFVTLSVR